MLKYTLALLSLCSLTAFSATNQHNRDARAILQIIHPVEEISTLNPENIMRLTLEHSTQIQAAKHKLESAEYNFKLFNSEFTQFTPLNLNSKLSTEGYNEHNYNCTTTAGVRKDYFGGGSLSADIGNYSSWDDKKPGNNTQFVKAEVRFPLFSSNRKLTRIIKRTFEENELYEAQLDYVNSIRRTILYALANYYDYLCRVRILQDLRSYQNDLIKLKAHPSFSDRPTVQQQIEGEINELTLEIQDKTIEVDARLIWLERWIGIDQLSEYRIEPIELDYDQDDYYGRFYVEATYEEVLNLAVKNDSDLKVLRLIKQNAIEKKRLAQQGKWDIFLSIGGRYNFYEEENGVPLDSSYSASTGIELKRFDRTVLRYTINKAEADILEAEAKIEDRLGGMAAEITQKKESLSTKKEQVLSARKNLASRQEIHDLKLEQFLAGNETADNYLKAFNALYEGMEKAFRQENRYLDAIRDFNYICGEYFQTLGLEAH